MAIVIFTPDEQLRFEIAKVRDLYMHKNLIFKAIEQYLEQPQEVSL